MATPKKLKILCFGNSLTSGYSQNGLASFPYADTMEPDLKRLVPTLEDLVVDIDGLPGDCVIPSLGLAMRRMEHRLQKHKDTKAYDWIIIMSGTNDLGWGRPPQQIFEALSNLYTLVLSSSPTVCILALNIIECATPSLTFREKRKNLNSLIAAHAQEEERLHVCDLCSAIPYFDIDKVERGEIWDDGLHLTEKGYEKMGQVVAGRLAEILNGIGNEEQKDT